MASQLSREIWRTLVLAWVATAMPCARTTEAAVNQPIQASIFDASPARSIPNTAQKAAAARHEQTAELSNNFLIAEISTRTGVVQAVTNRITGQRHALIGDATGTTIVEPAGKREWLAGEAHPREFKIDIQTNSDSSQAKIVLTDGDVRIVYELSAGDHWLGRRIVTNIAAGSSIDRLVYGACAVENGKAHLLTLGKFDRPSIVHVDKGGLFAGVEHWFYSVENERTYLNKDMAWDQPGEFESEPWYVGIFADEPGEPYPGWAWYKAYLQRTRAAAAKHDAWFSWNAGWGQWGIEIDDPGAPTYLELMKRLGINGVVFGSGGFGKGIGPYAELPKQNETAKANVALLKELKIAGGTLNDGRREWDKPERQKPLLDELTEYAQAGFGVTAFDFFSTPDTYAAHRRVANYFRAARDQLDYTECHLGMGVYGPQFQRMVRVNHPDDIHGFDISHFSSNWATFLAFRDSRRKWQQKYDYLMPEDGLYYFLTHYANWGNPRRYTDPEPQQFLWSVAAYCGIGFNFHDTFGWREAIAASSAFTTSPVFGHIELKMPPRDIEYARKFFAWMKDNAAILQQARVCAESETHCVLSKLRDGKGLVYVVNYHPGARPFQLKLSTGHSGPLSIRQVYPALGPAREMKDGEVLDVAVRGESTAIFEVNSALKSLPPENRSRFPMDLELSREQDAWAASFEVPDVRAALSQAGDPALPKRLLSLDQVTESRPDLMVNIWADKDRSLPAVKWIGKGKLPQQFREVYGFKDDETVETWKIVPWAMADRVWLVLRPSKPVSLSGPHPSLNVGGKSIPMMPRVDHRFDDVAKWNCPLYHADITEAVQFGKKSDLKLTIPGQSDPPIAYVISAADRN